MDKVRLTRIIDSCEAEDTLQIFICNPSGVIKVDDLLPEDTTAVIRDIIRDDLMTKYLLSFKES